jgi:outer membrane biosynthesis protein TonB
MTIVANGANGGGFKDFGVFRNEASYTVYLDMADTGIYGSSWALQYALDSQATTSAHGSLVPPYAISKSLPHFSSDAVKRGRGGTVVVFGVISTQGKFEKLRVMHSLDPGLDKYLLDSLGIWTFRPAEMDGTKVAVKVLLGIPVNFVQ